ncbi:uncharacterized protein LOC108916875 isoform X2 [Anoplophora glabripennis]|nr:uncharacterized protein LOC108914492 isoform X2 [Anoplophora glabripennis]XP_018578702.1 uncharacterized protein LOC108916875 isoform X2 [Anoplophora glabripennis]
MFCVVREFLEFFNLYFTLSVFDPESYMGNGYKYEGREKVAKDLGLDNADDTKVPLLMQLIKIARAKTKTLEINLNVNKDDLEENRSIHDNSTSNLTKTDSNNVPLDETITILDSDKILIENCNSVPEKLNITFDLSSPTVNFNIVNNPENMKTQTAQIDVDSKHQILENTFNKKEEKDDDTYGDTSSIAEDSISLVNSENVTVPQITVNGLGDSTLISEFVNDVEIFQPILKECKTLDKPKVSPQKPDKLKSKNSLSTLSDLPPLQVNKSRVNDILPSLYSKEFKDKSNLRELDKLFDMEAEYEEDFICSGDDLSLKSEYMKSDHTKSNPLDDLHQSNKSTSSDKSISSKRDLKQKVPNRIISDCNKQMFKALVSSSKTKDTFKNTDTASKSEVGSNTVNESLDINNSV